MARKQASVYADMMEGYGGTDVSELVVQVLELTLR